MAKTIISSPIFRLPFFYCLLLFAFAGSMGISLLGCRESAEGPIAGRAYIEDEDGNLIPADQHHSRGISPTPARPADSVQDWLTEFKLTERSGRTVSSQDLRGEPYIVSFFFTTCPTICKRQNEKVKALQQQFKGQPIKFVSITCDPEVDNPEVLSIYADQFGADPNQWLFLTGEMNYLRRVGTEIFFVAVDRRFHADKFLLIDADGQLYAGYEWPDENAWQTLQKDILAMLEAGGRLPAKQPDSANRDLDNELD
jgi:protein SCO1